VKKSRSDLKDQAVKFKGGCCEICGYKKTQQALEFHHLYSLEKEFNISSRMRTLKSIKKELDKTVLLCSNCHREVHAGYHNFYLEQFDNLEDLGEEE
jgi:hypothetical protein